MPDRSSKDGEIAKFAAIGQMIREIIVEYFWIQFLPISNREFGFVLDYHTAFSEKKKKKTLVDNENDAWKDSQLEIWYNKK